MVFLLSSEFRAPADQEIYLDFDESEYEEIVAKLTVIQQAIFDKPVKHRHLKALYVDQEVYSNFNELEYEEIAAKLIVIQ